MGMTLAQLLESLDPTDDVLWTADGLPKTDVVSDRAGTKITRQQITEAAPGLTRVSALESLTAREAVANRELEELIGGDDEKDKPSEEPKTGPESSSSDNVCVMDMDFADVMRSPELLTAVIREIDAKCKGVIKEKERLQIELKTLWGKSELASRQLARVGPPKDNLAGIKAYLEKNREVREKRVELAQRFINAGTTAQDVAEQLQGSSKLDAAMRQRKPGLGATRPAPRVPAKT